MCLGDLLEIQTAAETVYELVDDLAAMSEMKLVAQMVRIMVATLGSELVEVLGMKLVVMMAGMKDESLVVK